MFRENPISFTQDGSLVNSQTAFSSMHLRKSDCEIKKLQQDWPGIFRFLIIPKINECSYAVLYSDNKASRPNAPVNITVGALILKEYLCLDTDEDLCAALSNDDRIKYALCCDDFISSPVSVNTIGNFRRSVAKYYCETGENLLYKTFQNLTQYISEAMCIDSTIRSIDSTPIEMWNKTMGRMLLLYTNNEVFIEAITGYKIFKRSEKTNKVKPTLNTPDEQISFVPQVDSEAEDAKAEHRTQERLAELRTAKELLPEPLHCYLDAGNKNAVTYHSDMSRKEREKMVIAEARILFEFCEQHPEYKNLEKYELFVRIFNEQCKFDGENYVFKGKGEGMSSDMVQNPFDPEATFRSKDGKKQRGYTAAFTKASNADGDSIMEDFVVATNNTQDKDLGAELMRNMPAADPSDGAVMIGDGLFTSEEMKAIGEEKNITLITTNLTGIKPLAFLANLEFDENGVLTRCAGGIAPLEEPTQYNNGQSRAKIDKSCCESCKYNEQCNFKEQSSCNVIQVSPKVAERAMEIQFRDTEEFETLSHIRNGVETEPSILKNKYHIEKTRGIGVQPRAMRMALVSIAMNFKNFVSFMKRKKMRLCFA